MLSLQFRVFACARGASRAGTDARFADLLAAGASRQASLEMIELDVGDSASIVAATAQIGAKTNSVDLLINNAGVRECCTCFTYSSRIFYQLSFYLRLLSIPHCSCLPTTMPSTKLPRPASCRAFASIALGPCCWRKPCCLLFEYRIEKYCLVFARLFRHGSIYVELNLNIFRPCLYLVPQQILIFGARLNCRKFVSSLSLVPHQQGRAVDGDRESRPRGC